jgi:hypothetical protein
MGEHTFHLIVASSNSTRAISTAGEPRQKRTCSSTYGGWFVCTTAFTHCSYATGYSPRELDICDIINLGFSFLPSL